MKRITKALVAIMLMTMVTFTPGCENAQNAQNAQNNEEGEVNINTNVVGGHEYVDLGLPSGTLWATRNIGADTPDACGSLFAWGETTPKTSYSWCNYKHSNDCRFNDDSEEFECGGLTKYCWDSNFGYNGFTDTLTILQPGDDAATAHWGNGWRIPVTAQWVELLENTTQKWTTQNGVGGLLFTASNGNSIFLPAVIGFPSNGGINTYRSASLSNKNTKYAESFEFNENDRVMEMFWREYGIPVRPVYVK